MEPTQQQQPLESYLEQYLRILRIWNNQSPEEMSFGQVCTILRSVTEESKKRGYAGQRLARLAHDLLWEIVYELPPVPEVEAAYAEQVVQTGSGVVPLLRLV